MERYTEEQRQIIEQIDQEILKNDPVHDRCRYVEFLSKSAGKGRRRKPRDVQFLIVDEDYAHQVQDEQIIPRSGKISPDVLAMEILIDLPMEERTPEVLLQRASKLSSL